MSSSEIIPEGYVIGLGRDYPNPKIAHLYEGDFHNVGRPLCHEGYNRYEGRSWSIWRNPGGDFEICPVCLERAKQGKGGVASIHCEHQDDEDCMICDICGECREDLNTATCVCPTCKRKEARWTKENVTCPHCGVNVPYHNHTLVAEAVTCKSCNTNFFVAA